MPDFADKIHVPLTLLYVISSPWPLSMWGIDVIGMIEPKASNGHRFILIAIDYFTKWVEAASYANVTKQVVVRFIKNNMSVWCVEQNYHRQWLESEQQDDDRDL